MAVNNDKVCQILCKLMGVKSINDILSTHWENLKKIVHDEVSLIIYKNIKSTYEICDLVDALLNEIANILNEIADIEFAMYNPTASKASNVVKYRNFKEWLDDFVIKYNSEKNENPGSENDAYNIEDWDISGVLLVPYNDSDNKVFQNTKFEYRKPRHDAEFFIWNDPEFNKFASSEDRNNVLGTIIYRLIHLSYFGSHINYFGFPLVVLAYASNEQALKMLNIYKDHVGQCYLDYINDEDAKYTYRRNAEAAGGEANATYRDRTTEINFKWLKASLVIDKKYDIDAMLKKQSEFSITFKAINNEEVRVTGIVKVRKQADNTYRATIKVNTSEVKMRDKLESGYKDIKTTFKYGKAVEYNVVNKIKEYFEQVVAEAYPLASNSDDLMQNQETEQN